MSRLIELPDELPFDSYDKEHANEHFIYGVETMKEWIKNQPTVDAVPVVHARWISQEVQFTNGKLIEECGNCLEWSYEHNKSYCPNCGARMDGDE